MVNDNDQDIKPTCNGTMNGDTITPNGSLNSATNGLSPNTTNLIPNGHNIMNDIDEDEMPSLENVAHEGTKEEVKDNVSEEDTTTEVKEGDDGSGELEKEKDSNKVDDVIVIQDAVFTIKIQPPGTEVFDLQVSRIGGCRTVGVGVIFYKFANETDIVQQWRQKSPGENNVLISNN